MTHHAERDRPHPGTLRELALLFLRLGSTAFGGPAVHIAMLHDEVVTRRRWMDEPEFLDLMGATNLIPGPNSTEMAIHVGLARARWKGLIVAGVSFVLPAMLIVLALAWSYVRFGTTPAGESLLYGISPVVIAVVLQALGKLGRTAVKRSPLLVAVGVAAFTLYLIGVNELVVLFGGGLVVLLLRGVPGLGHGSVAGLLAIGPAFLPLPATLVDPPNVELGKLFLLFLKFGAVVFGSGYVLLAFIRGDLVHGLGWLTERQLVDAIAVGQLTPGPLFTTATFIGYVLAGLPGAILATVGIFLPGFVFVACLQPLVRAVRRHEWTGDLLDGVNVGALGLMAGVTWQLARAAIVDVPTAVLGLVAAILLLRFRVNSAWLVLGGAVVGLLVHPYVG
ncbi:MAG TPA: chromate efflux transporter [Actinomycetota bacterium]